MLPAEAGGNFHGFLIFGKGLPGHAFDLLKELFYYRVWTCTGSRTIHFLLIGEWGW